MKEKYVQTNIRLPQSLLKELKKQAAEEEKSLASLLRELARSYLLGKFTLGKNQIEKDPIWQLPDKAVKTGEKNLASNIDRILYGEEK